MVLKALKQRAQPQITLSAMKVWFSLAFEINHDTINMFLCHHTLLCIFEGLQPGTIVLIVFGVLLLAAVIAVAGAWFLRRKSEYSFLYS